MYWVNNALWIPLVYTLFDSILDTFYFPELSLWGKITIGIALVLLTATLNVVALRPGKQLSNLGALLKLLAVLALGIGGLYFGWNHGFANGFSLDSIVPSSPGQMVALGVMVYSIMGTGLACCNAVEMCNARRDILRVVLISGLIIDAFNTFDTPGVLAAVPTEETDVIRVFTRTLYNIYGHDDAGGMPADLIGAFVLFTPSTNMTTRSMGTNRAVVEATKAGELSALFDVIRSRHDTPIGSAILASTVSIALLLPYSLVAHIVEELFWTLLPIFAVVFMMPYVPVYLAFIRLRHADSRPQPYRMSLSDRLTSLWTLFIMLHVLTGIGLFVVIPGVSMDWARVSKIAGGMALALVVDELLIRQAT